MKRRDKKKKKEGKSKVRNKKDKKSKNDKTVNWECVLGGKNNLSNKPKKKRRVKDRKKEENNVKGRCRGQPGRMGTEKIRGGGKGTEHLSDQVKKKIDRPQKNGYCKIERLTHYEVRFPKKLKRNWTYTREVTLTPENPEEDPKEKDTMTHIWAKQKEKKKESFGEHTEKQTN